MIKAINAYILGLLKEVNMMKKFITAIFVVCFVVVSISFICFAEEPSFLDGGVDHGYNGSFWYDQAWVNVRGDTSINEEDYYVYVWIEKDDDDEVYGFKRSTVLANHYSRCTSYQVQGSGGKMGCDCDLKE